MNIYECLGFEANLMNLDIPIETIIENISDFKMKQESEKVFATIKNVKLQFSIHRGECYFQVIEVELDSPENINDISRIMQQAIKYRILFVFTFNDRHLLLWRNFILTKNTKYIYTAHIVQCTNWIYAESLHEDILFNCDIHSVNNIDDDEFYVQSDKMHITDNDNCDTQHFHIVLNNVIRLNNCIVNSDIVCARYLIDWLQNHRIRENISIYEIAAEMFKNENFSMLGDNLFFEKSALSNVISTLENLQFLHTFDVTGRYPMEYFSTIAHPATYEDEYDLFSRMGHSQKCIEYDENDYVVQFDNEDNIKKVPVQCGGVICSSDAYSTLNGGNRARVSFKAEKELQIVSSWCDKICTFLETYNEADNQQMGNNQEVKGVLNMVQDPSIDKKLAITLEELDLSVRSYNCLKRAGIHTVNDIVNKSVDDLYRVRNLSRKCIEEIIEKITKLGFELKKECKYCYTTLTDEDLSFDDDLCAICRARELRTSKAKDITLEILPLELSSYTVGYSKLHIFVNINNNTDKPLKLKLKECSIIKDGRQQTPKDSTGYSFYVDYIFPNTIKTFAKVWETDGWSTLYPDKGNYLTICLENYISDKIYFFKYEYHKSEENWYFYDYYEIE